MHARIHLRPTEALLLLLVAAVGLACLAGRGSTQFDLGGYGVIAGLSACTLLLGTFYRISGRSERLAATLVVTGLFLLLTASLSTLNYLALPIGRTPIDPWLLRLDHLLFGFSWQETVLAFADRPVLSALLGLVYQSSLFQIVLVFLVLGFGGHIRELDRTFLTLTIAALFAVAFWTLWPSLGPTTLPLSTEAAAAASHLVVGPEYGADLQQLLTQGASFVSPAQIKGLIAFPSFHTVLAILAVWAVRAIPAAFFPLALVNAAMLPAIVLHGGHFIIDLLGGLSAFSLAACMARALERDLSQSEPWRDTAGGSANEDDLRRIRNRQAGIAIAQSAECPNGKH